MEAGAWEAMKEARAIYDAGKVIEASYEPPVLAGRVRGADGEFRAGLHVRSRTDMENTCTCPTSRRRGLICAHSLAVGVAVIRGLKKPEPTAVVRGKCKAADAPAATESSAENAAPAPASDPNFSSNTDGPEAALHVILPPNLAAAWEKNP